jgi:hypothetical protein
MAKELRTNEYRASHGKRPGGYGSWAFRVTNYRESSLYHLQNLSGAPFFAQTNVSTDGSFTIIIPAIKYGEATKILRHQLRSDRTAIIEVLP